MAGIITPSGHALGVRWGTPDPRTYRYEHVAAATPPPDISLRPRQQRPTNQGQLSSCTGHAGANGLEGILRDGPRSPLYLYYYDRVLDGTPPSTDGGATMLALCKALQRYGAPPEAAWPYDPSRFSQRPPAQADAAAVRIESYAQVQATGLALLQGTWEALKEADGDPRISILLALDVYAEFEQSRPDGIKAMPAAGSRALGGHAIEVTDWSNNNAAAGGYGYVGCQGSWGADFDDGGYHWLPAAYFTWNIVREVWVVRYAALPPTEDDVDVAAVQEKLQQLRNLVAQAQADRCAYWADQAQYQASMAQIMDHDIGPLYDVANQIEALLSPKAPPEPPPAPQFVLPVANGGILGKTKWLPGSLGCDVFVPRNTAVLAPADCVVEEVIGGTGQQGGAELILSLADKSWAWRYRHVQARSVTVGQTVRQGQPVGVVLDTSLDQLCAPPVVGYPDRWQHLDLSVNKGTDRFAPTGGGGGNVSAYQWLADTGYQGRVLAQTPGPPSCGLTFDAAIALLTPAGRQ